MRTVVAKFGGTSLADAAHFQRIREIVSRDPARRILVVSAPGKRFPEDVKVTDLLSRCYEAAVRGKSFEADLAAIEARYRSILEGLSLPFPLAEEIGSLRSHLTEHPDREYTESRGEYLNARILADFLGFTFVDPAWCVCFDENGLLDAAMTRRAMGAALRPLTHAVIAGFYGAEAGGRIHTFSRGGSDVTGSLAACAIEAELYENWTDVSGLLAADPRIVEQPKSVEYLSYRELRTLSYMGASVLHTDAVLPASDLGIPINIRNTEDPENPGTMIVRKLPKNQKKYPMVGVAGRKGMSVIQVEKVMTSDGSGFSAIMLDILKKRQLPFEQCLTGIDTITLVIRDDLLSACKEELFAEIRQELHPDYLGLKENLSMIAVVGEKGPESCNANVEVLQALANAGIEISTVNQGAGKLNLLIGIPESRYEDAIRAIYTAMEHQSEDNREEEVPMPAGGPGGPMGRGFLTEEEKQNQPKITPALLRRVFSYLYPYRMQLLLVLVCILASSIFSMMPSILTGKIIDEGLIKKDLRALVTYIVLSLAVTLAANLIGVAESYINNWIAQHITFDMRNQMFSHLQSMSQRFFTANNQGDIITRMTSDIDGVERVITGTFTSILSNSITLVVAMVAMYQKNWILATLGIVIVPLFALPTRQAGKTRWTLTREAQACNDEINGILNETMSVSGQLLVKLFGKESYEYERYRSANERMIRLNIREGMAGRWFRVVLSTVTSIGPMLIYLAGGILMMRYDSNLTVGDISVLVALLGRMYMPVNQLMNIQVDWIRSMAMFTRIFEYFDMPAEIENAPDAVAPEAPVGEVIFDHVNFSYEPGKQILSDISFHLEQGRSIAIVGPSGSGKSTIVNLIPRLYDVGSGSVSFDGIDVRKLDLTWLRSQIGVVSQETYLFNGTIRDNLRYACPEATEEEMIAACKQANIWSFVEKQEQGLDTMVGNRGLKLSGGEKQRISIARVLLKNPSLFIFDEATSALDSISENKIQEAIDPIIHSRTSILIAHRLSTILAADEILVVKDGTVVERGQHKDLVKAGGVYTELYETQFGAADNRMPEPVTIQFLPVEAEES